ncbi:hypothetical protein [Pseudonocardia sp.]|uniref:hypothetical protein n=1 Tax=Pseudonocardia sp. TaxID=60912 RepID=UPI003D123678
MSAFHKFRAAAWPYRYRGTLTVTRICGGVPTDPKVAEGWLRTKLGVANDHLIQQQVAEVMADRGVTADEAVAEVDTNRHLNGFKRDDQGLYIEGRQLKAAIKEAASVAAAAGKLPLKSWGKTNKGLLGFIAEHVCVVDDRLHLGVSDASGIEQRFVHTWRGTGIQYEEYVDDAKISFEVIADHPFTDEQWAMIWLTGEQQGIGATRSQGYGRYTVTSWEKVSEVAS